VIACVGAVVHDDRGRLLVVQRANEPARGRWSLPGGRVEPGETDVAALVREVREETGLSVAVGRLVGRVARGRYDIADHACTVLGGQLSAGDDALAVRWVTLEELAGLPVTPGLVETLAEWEVLPAAGSGG
jgi:8-oxo-dGTP diphosphatase